MPILAFQDRIPTLTDLAFLAPDAWISGQTSIAKDVSIFFGVVIRGDINPVSVGEGSNLQEQAMLHTSHGLGPCSVGKFVTVGHHAIVHGACVKDNCIIGMGTTLLDGAIIEENCIIGANSLVTMKTIIPAGSLALGSPAKVVRKLRDEEIRQIRESAQSYIETGKEYTRQFAKIK